VLVVEDHRVISSKSIGLKSESFRTGAVGEGQPLESSATAAR